MHYLFLLLAILTETVGTMALQASQQFSRFGPSVVVVVGYAASFYFMALTLKVMPVGIVYAIWSGLGMVLIAGLGYVMFGQKLDFAAMAGIALILVGVLVIHGFSDTSAL